MRKLIIFLIPVGLRRRLIQLQVRLRQDKQLLKMFLYDAVRYYRFHYRRGCETSHPEHLQAMMIMEAHAVEKGFCFPEPRLGYGATRIRQLIEFMKQYKDAGFDCEHFAFRNAQSVLMAYLKHHEEKQHDLGEIRKEIFPWADGAGDIGGYKQLSREDVLEQASGSFESCAMSRYSVRNFSTNPVPEELIQDAVRIAQKSPSVCNR